MKNNNQETPIDWLVKQLKKQYNIHIDILAITDKAKEMHKEQITTAYLTGIMHPLEMEATKQAEQYYNEIYNTIK